MDKRKIILIFFGLTFIITIYLILMSYVDEKSIGLWESIVETEHTNEVVRSKELLKIRKDYKELFIMRGIYFTTCFVSLFVFTKKIFQREI